LDPIVVLGEPDGKHLTELSRLAGAPVRSTALARRLLTSECSGQQEGLADDLAGLDRGVRAGGAIEREGLPDHPLLATIHIMGNSSTPRIEINGRAATAEQLHFRALADYGHFTGMEVRKGRVRGLDLHLARLDAGTRELFDNGGRLARCTRSSRDHHATARATPDRQRPAVTARHGAPCRSATRRSWSTMVRLASAA
jgi:hypothetical protein